MGVKLSTIEKLEQIDQQIEMLYEKKRKALHSLYERHGDGAHCYPLEKADKEGNKFIRMRIIDHLENFTSGAPIYRMAGVQRFELKIDRLKNKPKEMAE